MRLLAMVEEPANFARVLRRQALGDEGEGQGRWVPHTA
jgi:hypothetical protein